jgi:hypothetical protein
VKRRRSRDVVRVHVPRDQAPLFHVPGPHGGWFISLLYGFGLVTDAPMQELRKLLAGSRGEVILARRLTRGEAHVLERRRADCDADLHAWLIPKEEQQFRRSAQLRRQARRQARVRQAGEA